MSLRDPKTTESTKNEPAKPSVSDTPMAVKMLSNLCNIRMKVRGLSEKMRDLVDATNSGMSSVEQINQFLDQLEKFQCIVVKDLNKTGEVARCQYKVINDIESFMDTLKNRQRKLRNLCLDIKEDEGEIKTIQAPYECSCPNPCGSECVEVPEEVEVEEAPVCTPLPSFPVINDDLEAFCAEPCVIENEEEPMKECNVFISDIHPLGKFIKITNNCGEKVQDLGGYTLCQIVEDCDYSQFSIFRFPLRVGLPPKESLKVWSRCYDPGLCKSSRDFVATEMNKWSTTPEVITKLCDCADETVSWIKGCRMTCVPGF